MMNISSKVTRQQTAREEIDTAIDLLFRGGSLISANLLAWAAIDVLRGVAKSRSLETLGDRIMDHIVEERAREWINALKEHYNFAKHADRDPDKEVEIKPEIVEMAVFQAVVDYGTVYRASTLPMLMVRSYMFGKNPEFANEAGRVEVEVAQRAFGEAPTLERVSAIYRAYKADKASATAMIPPEMKGWLEL